MHHLLLKTHLLSGIDMFLYNGSGTGLKTPKPLLAAPCHQGSSCTAPKANCKGTYNTKSNMDLRNQYLSVVFFLSNSTDVVFFQSFGGQTNSTGVYSGHPHSPWAAISPAKSTLRESAGTATQAHREHSLPQKRHCHGHSPPETWNSWTKAADFSSFLAPTNPALHKQSPPYYPYCTASECS